MSAIVRSSAGSENSRVVTRTDAGYKPKLTLWVWFAQSVPRTRTPRVALGGGVVDQPSVNVVRRAPWQEGIAPGAGSGCSQWL